MKESQDKLCTSFNASFFSPKNRETFVPILFPLIINGQYHSMADIKWQVL